MCFCGWSLNFFTTMLQSHKIVFFNSLARSRYLSFFSHSFSFILWSAGTANQHFGKFSFFFLIIIIRSSLPSEIRWSVCMSKSHWSLCVSSYILPLVFTQDLDWRKYFMYLCFCCLFWMIFFNHTIILSVGDE